MYITPELFLVIFNLSCLCMMLFVKSPMILSNGNKISALALIITAVLVYLNPVKADPIINGFYTSNEFTAFFKMLILVERGTSSSRDPWKSLTGQSIPCFFVNIKCWFPSSINF